MKKILLILAAVCWLAVPALAQDEAKPAAEAAPAVAPQVNPAKEYNDDIKTARDVIRVKNSALAAALGKTDGFSEDEVISAYQDLKSARGQLEDAELRALLFYKNNHPSWKPDTGGKKVRVPNLNKTPEQNDKDREARQNKRKEAKEKGPKGKEPKPKKAAE